MGFGNGSVYWKGKNGAYMNFNQIKNINTEIYKMLDYLINK